MGGVEAPGNGRGFIDFYTTVPNFGWGGGGGELSPSPLDETLVTYLAPGSKMVGRKVYNCQVLRLGAHYDNISSVSGEASLIEHTCSDILSPVALG